MTKKHHKLLLRFDRALSNSLAKQIAILTGILVVTLLVSFLFLSLSGSNWMVFCHQHKLSPWLLPVFLLIDSNALNGLYMDGDVHGWMLFACSITYMCGFLVFNGMLVGVITNAIGNRVEAHRDGLTHYLESGHYVIMGYDEMVPSIVEEIFAKDKDAYILLLTAFDAKKITERLKKSVARHQMDQIIVNYGQRTAKEYYNEIHLESASEIFIVGNRTRPAHDAINVECVDSICTYLNEHPSGQMPKRITCVFEDIDTYAAFKTSEIFGEVRDLNIEFVPYNFYSGWAKQVFLARSYKEKKNSSSPIFYPSVYGDGISPKDKKFVHLVFIGTTNFAVSFAMEAAQMLHFPNFDEDTKKPKTRITFIELNADKEMALFKTRNRHLFEIQNPIYTDLSKKSCNYPESNTYKQEYKQQEKENFLDVEFEFIKGDVFSDEVQELIESWANDKKGQHLSIFLAMADQRNNFIMGMNMPDAVYDKEIPVFIRQSRSDNFVTNLRNTDAKDRKNKEFEYSHVVNGKVETEKRHGRYANIYPFGMDDMAYCTDETAFKRAKLVNYLYHNIKDNRFPDFLVLDATPTDTIWADAEKHWRKLSVANKWSNLYCAYSIPCKLASLRVMRGLEPDDFSHDQDRLSYEEIEKIARVEHNRWNVEKLLMGYRKAENDEDKYTQKLLEDKHVNGNKKLFIHQDIRPFSALPESTQQLDFEIAKYIPWILKMTEV